MQLDRAGVVVTGAGSGIGQALAIALSKKGARVILTGRRPGALEDTISMLDRPDDALAVPADVTSPAGRAELRDAVKRHLGGLEVLINNAGTVEVNLLENTSDEAIRRLCDTNLVAPIALTRELIPMLRAAAPSHVVNIGSMFGDIAFPLFAAYSATKFGLRGFSDALRRELKKDNIAVTYVAPRATRTPAADSFDHLAEPFSMAFDTPESVASAIVDGIEKGKRTVYPRGPERIFIMIQHFFPGVVDGSLISQFAKVGKGENDT